MIQASAASSKMSSISDTVRSSKGRLGRRSRPPHRSSYQFIAGDEFRSLDASMSPRRTRTDAERLSRVFSQAVALAAQGDLQRLKSIAIAESLDVNGANRRGWRLIQVAAEGGHLHIVIWLLDAGVDGDVRDALGWSPLMLAASRDRVAVIHALLQRGYHRSLLDAVRVAAANNCLLSLQVLLARTHVKDGQCDQDRCPVRLAAEHRYYGAVQALLVAGYSARCIRNIHKDYELKVIMEIAAGARRVLSRGLKGVIVSALIDDRGPMRISIHLMWSGIEVRLRRKRNMFFRKRARPMLAHIGYDQQIRLLTHDALVIGQMTIKLDPSPGFNSQHLIVALRQRQLAWSESYHIVAEAHDLVHLVKVRAPQLIAGRLENQTALNQIAMAMPGASDVVLHDAIRLAGHRLEIDRELQDIRARVVKNIQLSTDIATILEVGQRLAEADSDFVNETVASGKQSRFQRELDKVYICRTQLQGFFSALASLDVSDRRVVSSTDRPSLKDVRSVTPNGLCQLCDDAPATIAFDSCRHLGLCQTCRQDRQWKRTRCRICHSRVDSIVANAVNV